MTAETALALRPISTVDPYAPSTFAEAQAMARAYAASRILGSAYGTPEAVLLVMATGAELGIAPTAALRGLYVVEGRIYMSADLMVALVLRSPVCDHLDLIESTAEIATYEAQRKGGKAVRMSFTAADKAKAGLGGAHSKYPATMLRHRAAAQICRAVFPDVILGMYADEERDEMVPAAPTVAPADVQPVIHEAEIVEGWPARFAAAADESALAAVAGELQKVKASLSTDEQKAARAAYKLRKAEIEDAARTVDLSTGEVTEPGANG